ncbi:MAG: hypothetical protein EOP51_21305 [Sphingobacteriales bacterium]|nr:MAG: hypothetical protein EOP51_21305 [Sphingobacteriales bacterium]
MSTQAPAHGRKAAVAIARMPLSETELRLVEAMFENKRDVKAVLQVLPHAVVSTLYRQKKNYDTFGSIHKPETTKKRRLRKPVVADADPDPEASTTPSSSDSPPSRLSDTDRTVEMLFSQGCSVRVVQSWFPNRPKSSLYRMQHNLDVYGSVRKPETMWKKKGRPCSVTPEMKEWLVQLVKEGKEIYDFVESRLDINPVGLVPLVPYQGYFSLRNGNDRTGFIYEYQLTIFEGKDDKYRGINIQFIDTYQQSITNTPEAIKLQLIKKHKHLPNPAVYYVQSDISFPLEQTLLPVAKRSLVKYISNAA